MKSALRTNSVLSGRRSNENRQSGSFPRNIGHETPQSKGVGRCGNGFGCQPSFDAVVEVEGTLRLATIGWDMALETEESLAPHSYRSS